MDLKTLLADKTKWADDREVDFGDGVKVKIGDLRAAQKLSEDQAAAAQKAAQEREAAAARQIQEAADLITKLQANPDYAGLGAPQRQQQNNAQAFDYERDPILGPLVKRLSDAEQKVQKEYAEKLQQIDAQLKQTSTYYLQREWKKEWESLPATEREGHDFKKALEFAAKERLVDEDGVPSIRKAVEKLNEPKRLELLKKEAFEAGRKKAMEEAALSSVGKPSQTAFSSAPPKAAQRKAGDPIPSIEQAVEAARGDAETMNMWNNIDWDSAVNSIATEGA